MSVISLDHQSERVRVSAFEVENPIVFGFFNKLSTNERDDQFHRALYIGILALMEDRLSAFLAKTTNELGTELESLKIIFDMKQELFYRSAVKGILAEEEIAQFLSDFLAKQRLQDSVELTGNTSGKLARNKTGDIVCHIGGNKDVKIAIECKFDKNVRLGDIETRDIFARRSDTAWSQLLEAQANREGRVGIIVFDASLVDSSIANAVPDLRYLPEIGFVAIVDSQKGDYRNLAIAYMLARDIAVNNKDGSVDRDILALIVTRIIKDVRDTLSIKSLIHANMENCKKMLAQIERSLLSMEFSQRYLSRFLANGTLTKDDLLDFYAGDEVREKFRSIERSILDTGSTN